uniref:Integrase catalytic domain-containing protein n=1 Tax=Tanacetum cinerariifolium TaxID=118510 RepID=A0A6L2NDC0_TANCI|nr:hypothetical protein [Tanacetum cinerariifolium]
MKGINKDFSVARTPQQNGVAERKNKTLIEAAKTMLHDSKLPTTFCAEVVNIACYVQNKVLVIKPHNKTPYELFLDRKPALSFMRPFGCPVLILNTIDHLVNTACYVQNKVLVIKPHNKTPYELFLDRKPALSFMRPFGCPVLILNTIDHLGSRPNWLFDIDSLTKSINSKPVVTGNQSNGSTGEEEKKDTEDPGNEESKASIIEEPRVNQEKDNVNSTNRVNVVSSTINAVSNEVNVVGRNSSIELPDDPNMPDLEDISIFEDSNEDEVYVCQPPSFEDLEFPDRVYKVEKALYGLHQAPRAWVKGDILLAQVYVDEIIFGSTRKEICTEFEKMMHKKFQMSSMGELTFFLGLQVTQNDDEIFISQDKYMDETLKKFGFSTVKTTSTPMETSKPLMKDENAENVDVHLYRSMIGSLILYTNDDWNDVKQLLEMELRLTLAYTYYCQLKVNAARHKLTTTVHIIDFLIANLIKYALTMNPTIYTLCIEQFWVTAKAKNINEEAQIHAMVDGKKVIISEATIRRYLKFKDEGEVAWLSNEVIFEQLPLMGKPRRQDTQETQPSGPTTNVAGEALNEENIPVQSNDLPLSRVNTFGIGEDSLKLNELMELCTKLSERALNLETTKTAQAKEILCLKRRVKRLEKKNKSRTHRLKRLYNIGLFARVELYAKEQSLDEEDASKQGRNIVDIDADVESTLVNETAEDQRRYDDQEMFDTCVLDDEEEVLLKEAQDV